MTNFIEIIKYYVSFYRFKKLFIFILTLPLIFLIRLVKSIKLIQFCEIRSDRIGHFTIDSMLKIFDPNNNSNEIRLYYLSDFVSNDQWKKMLKRKIKLYNFIKYLAWANKKIPGGQVHEKIINIYSSRDINGIFHNTKDIKIPFLNEEIVSCENTLRKVGWKKGDKIFCLLVRDEEYLNKYHNNDSSSFSYHNYRNSNIQSYIEGIDCLTKRKYWVFRMGKIMTEKVNFSNKYFIDYAFCDFKSDLLDIWLFANCNGCISTGSGLDMVSLIYQKPILFLNYIPLYHWWSFANSITLFKHLYWKESEVKLTLNEYIIHSYFKQKEYKKITIKDLSSLEIKEAIKEFIFFLDKGYHKHSKENLLLQKKFKKEIKEYAKFDLIHRNFHCNSVIGYNWLKKQGKFFFKR